MRGKNGLGDAQKYIGSVSTCCGASALQLPQPEWGIAATSGQRVTQHGAEGTGTWWLRHSRKALSHKAPRCGNEPRPCAANFPTQMAHCLGEATPGRARSAGHRIQVLRNKTLSEITPSHQTMLKLLKDGQGPYFFFFFLRIKC